MNEASDTLMLEQLKDQFRARCRADLGVLSGPDCAEFRHRVHRLAGTAGTLGFHALGRQAAAADNILHSGAVLGQAERDALISAVRAIL